MRRQHRRGRRDNFARVGLITVVVAFMVLRLVVASVDSARFALALGYPAEIGYAIGTIFDLG